VLLALAFLILVGVTPVLAAADEPPPAGAPALVEDPLGPPPVDTPEHEAYAHGSYWLFLAWNLFTLGFLWVLLQSRFASRVQGWAERMTRRPNLKVMTCVAFYSATLWLVSLPLAIATGFLREKRYGFMNQDLAGWMGDRGKQFVVSLLVRLLLVTLLYLLMRRLGRSWWMPGAVLTIGCSILGIVVAPVFIDPLFNTFTPLHDQALRSEILDMAHRQGIPAHEVYEMDASVQSEHNNAYVTGLFHTQRIVLYDTLLKRFAPREIRAVMGHEMGHYVLRHIGKTVAFLAPIILLGFLMVDRAARRLIASHPRWDIRRIEDPASLPVVALVALLYLLLVGPAIATFSRSQESAADRFGLEMTRDPEAMASSFIKFGRYDLSEYEAHPLIEFLLFSHPSVDNRVRQAQAWAHAHPGSVPAAAGAGDAAKP
jgi:STE24 endopeptidase